MMALRMASYSSTSCVSRSYSYLSGDNGTTVKEMDGDSSQQDHGFGTSISGVGSGSGGGGVGKQGSSRANNSAFTNYGEDNKMRDGKAEHNNQIDSSHRRAVLSTGEYIAYSLYGTRPKLSDVDGKKEAKEEAASTTIAGEGTEERPLPYFERGPVGSATTPIDFRR